jgi:hypothetical protein
MILDKLAEVALAAATYRPSISDNSVISVQQISRNELILNDFVAVSPFCLQHFFAMAVFIHDIAIFGKVHFGIRNRKPPLSGSITCYAPHYLLGPAIHLKGWQGDCH